MELASLSGAMYRMACVLFGMEYSKWSMGMVSICVDLRWLFSESSCKASIINNRLATNWATTTHGLLESGDLMLGRLCVVFVVLLELSPGGCGSAISWSSSCRTKLRFSMVILDNRVL